MSGLTDAMVSFGQTAIRIHLPLMILVVPIPGKRTRLAPPIHGTATPTQVIHYAYQVQATPIEITRHAHQGTATPTQVIRHVYQVQATPTEIIRHAHQSTATPTEVIQSR